MSKPIIKVENLSKMYRLGMIGTGTLSHDLNMWLKRVRGKDDDYMMDAGVGANSNAVSNGKYIWSLKDLNFEVAEGDIFGVIGKNGAGKSTLLKLLSKITRPTKGNIHLNGRIASLLEVGTGFHPDLSGRENVFLNGAILGMKKAEIKKKFDEIVDFSGVEKFIDTPVKRYSSGMYVRLAFAVAAHLEPEILIIDEVLAVGDAEFQKKCVGKIKDISFNKGRTILFVSHNVTAVKQLSSKVLFLEGGLQKWAGDVEQGLRLYSEKQADSANGLRNGVPVAQAAYFTKWQLKKNDGSWTNTCSSRDTCVFSISLEVKTLLANCEFRLMIVSNEAVLINSSSMDNGGSMFTLHPGSYDVSFSVYLPVSEGNYMLEFAVVSEGAVVDLWNPTTPLTVFDNFQTHVKGSLLNLDTSFSINNAVKNNAAHFLVTE